MSNDGFGQQGSGQGSPQGGWSGQGSGNGQPGGAPGQPSAPQWGQSPNQPWPAGQGRPPQQGGQQFPQQGPPQQWQGQPQQYPQQGQPQQPWQGQPQQFQSQQHPGQPQQFQHQQFQHQQYPQQQWQQPYQQGGFQPQAPGQTVKKTGAKVAIWVLVAVVLIGLGVGAYFLFFHDAESADTAAEQQTTAPAATQTAETDPGETEPAPETEGGDVAATEPAETVGPDPTVDPEQPLDPDLDLWTPPNGTEDYGILRSATGEISQDVPHVVLYTDFQCPACAARTENYGPAIDQLVAEGKITVEVRFATFMENNLGNDSSTRAAQASAAADAVGKFPELYSVIFANQSESGAGYTEQQLRETFPAEAGLVGDDLATYQQLIDADAFSEFVWMSNEVFFDSPAAAVPTFFVGDEVLEFYDQSTSEVLIEPTPESLFGAIWALF